MVLKTTHESIIEHYMQITKTMKIPVTGRGTEITLATPPKNRSVIHAWNMHLVQHTRNHPPFVHISLKNNCQVLALKLLPTWKDYVFRPSNITNCMVAWSSSYNMTIKKIKI